MGVRVAGGFVRALHVFAFRIENHHVLWPHADVLHAGGLDDRQPPDSVDARDAAPCEGNEIVLHQQVRLAEGFLQLFQHIDVLSKVLSTPF